MSKNLRESSCRFVVISYLEPRKYTKEHETVSLAQRLSSLYRNDLHGQAFAAAEDDDLVFFAGFHLAENVCVVHHIADVVPGELNDLVACLYARLCRRRTVADAVEQQ